MSKLMSRLERLEQFVRQGAEIKNEALALQQRERNMNIEMNRWIEQEIGIKGDFTMPELLKKVLETSFEPVGKIIAP